MNKLVIRSRFIVLALLFDGVLLIDSADADEGAAKMRVSDIAWMSGSRAGIGDDGQTTGNAYSIWTEPVEGVMSWTFRWHQAEEKHVHFTFSVLEETEVGVLLRGIHHGRNFDSFEIVNWTMQLSETSPSFAKFVCVMNCRAASVEIALLPDGKVLESWRSAANAEPGFVITYQSLASE